MPILDSFDPISLQQMDNVKLQDRVDTKFMFRDNALPDILKEMSKNYYLLEIAGKRFTHYETLYFDTKNFDLYLKHHNGRVNRFKFRSRRYVESDLFFFEIKFKNSRGRTIKDRIKSKAIVKDLDGSPKDLIHNISNVDPATLLPRLWVNYRRMTFVNKTSHERLTIDTDLTYVNDDKKVVYDGLVIAEVKRNSARDKSPFIEMMKNHHIAEKSISKYCLGVISLNEGIKKNNFKPTLIYLNKILKA